MILKTMMIMVSRSLMTSILPLNLIMADLECLGTTVLVESWHQKNCIIFTLRSQRKRKICLTETERSLRSGRRD